MEQARLNVGERGSRVSTLASAALAIAMIGAFVLVAGGVRLAIDRATRGRGMLMLVAAAVLTMNVMIWTL